MARTRVMAGKGPKSQAVRHRQTKAPIDTLTRPVMRRIGRRAGIRRVSKTLYPYMRKALVDFLISILKWAILLMEHKKVSTLGVFEVIAAMEANGRPLWGF